MIITWNLPRIRQIGAPFNSGLETITLAPGPNEVDEKAWNVAKTLPLVAADVASGLLVVEEGASYLSLPTSKRRKLVSEAADTELLGRWAELETHPLVSKAIADQIYLITHPKKPEV